MQFPSRIKLLTYGLIVLGLLAAAGWVKAYFWPNYELMTISAGPPRVPITVERTKEVVKWKTKVEVREVQVLVPPSDKAEKKIEDKFDVKLGDGPDELSLLTSVTLPKLPWGGAAIVTADKVGGIAVKVLPDKRPFFQLGGLREVTVYGGQAFGDDTGGTLYGVRYRQDILRAGPAVLGGEVAGESVNGRTGGKAAVSISVRF